MKRNAKGGAEEGCDVGFSKPRRTADALFRLSQEVGSFQALVFDVSQHHIGPKRYSFPSRFELTLEGRVKSASDQSSPH